MIDRVGAGNQALEDLLCVCRIIEPLAMIIEPIDQRSLLTCEQQPTVPEQLSAIWQLTPRIGPGIIGNLPGRSINHTDRIIRCLSEELECGICG